MTPSSSAAAAAATPAPIAPAAPDGGTGATLQRPPLLDSAQILQGHAAVEIHHQGSLYRLQATRQGKLILTK